MDWIAGMQRAIDYIEDNITEKLDYEKIAKRAYSSSFHFQRVFSIMCGYTIGEYIRNRRLTLAGSELINVNVKVIDIALKYGYDNPDSFAKAFIRFHGITPSNAKQSGANLKSFSRLSIKLSLEGGSIMDYKIEEKEAMQIVAKSKRFTTDNEVNHKQIPEFWNNCRANGTLDTLCGFVKPESIFGKSILGICEESTCKDAKDFEYSIGTQYLGGTIPDGYVLKGVPKLTWAIFKCKGAMPHGIQDGWHKIYSEFFPASEYRRLSLLDFEVYPEGNISSEDYTSEIWIPVEKAQSRI